MYTYLTYPTGDFIPNGTRGHLEFAVAAEFD